MIQKRFTTIVGIFALIMLVTSSCKHDRNHPGYVYMPDMYYSEPGDAYTANQVFSNGLTMQAPVEGTIPRGHMPYPYKAKSADNQKLAGVELMNPVEKSGEALDRGKDRYQVFCSACHGVTGKGNGHLYTYKLFTAKPTSLVDAYVQDKPDGEIFHVITKGSISGLMGAHGSQIPPDDRWKIIHYVRELGKK